MRVWIFFISLVIAQRNATLEFQLANLSVANFAGELKIYIGRNCETNVQSGRTCDYLYQGNVTYPQNVGLTINRGHFYQLPDLVEDDDLIIFTYRDSDEAIFRGIRKECDRYGSFYCDPGGYQTDIIELFNTKSGFTQSPVSADKYLVFDYDARNYVCASWYPRGTRCVWDVTFDLGARTMSYSASLISGKVGSTTSGGVSGGSKISLKTSETDAETYRGAKLNFYHAFNCDSDSCEYVKAGEIQPTARNTTYELEFPAMNFASDRLIMDTRHGTLMRISDLKFSAGGTVYDLLDFNKAEGGSKLGSFYSRYISNNSRSPCVNYNCFYDLVFDINAKTVYTEKPLIEGI